MQNTPAAQMQAALMVRMQQLRGTESREEGGVLCVSGQAEQAQSTLQLLMAVRTLAFNAHCGYGQRFKEVHKKMKEGTVQFLHTNKHLILANSPPTSLFSLHLHSSFSYNYL